MKTMNQVLPALACGAALLTAGQASAIVSTFDTDLEGWKPVGFNIDTSIGAVIGGNVLTKVDNTGDAVHDDGTGAIPGNPGGFARFTDLIEEPGSFLEAPSSFTNSGNLTAFKDGTLSYDHRLINQGAEATSVQDYVVLLISGNPNNFEAYAAVKPGPNLGDADTDWINVSFTLNETDFTAVDSIDLGLFDPDLAGDTAADLSGGLISTSSTFDEVLANVTTLLISFELVDNNSTQVSEDAGVDNVELLVVPEPNSLALVGLGGLLVARRRRG